MLRKIRITGVVQGVGFRPFVYQIATRGNLDGWVANTSAGVEIEVDGEVAALDEFTRALTGELPPLARIDAIDVQDLPSNGRALGNRFEIRESIALAGAFQPISPDISICPDCLRELFDPNDRRYRYPFINCTNCGPRFTIIRDIPYDRPLTTMAAFGMCEDCAREYHDPRNRRFHAQPVACPKCGPRVWLVASPKSQVSGDLGHEAWGEAAIVQARELLTRGNIVAIKGLGGFHLACDASNLAAVAELRRRKLRVDKPFALMMSNLESVEANCSLTASERSLLESCQHPVVILKRRPASKIVTQVCPGQDTLGVMLPYTPLHHLLLEPVQGFPRALVMTSGNLSEEPIATDNDDARARLANLADSFLLNDRDIHVRCDDSVVRMIPAPPSPVADGGGSWRVGVIRRSRGYAPFPVRLPWDAPPLLATGAELKNAFCIARDRYAFLSHHIGDMENYETLRSFEDGVAHFERLFRVRPQVIAYDLHPNYMATRYALERAERDQLPAIGVQHHHAHIAACMVENGLSGEQPAIGVAFDGSGYGDDATMWGGEFLVADYAGYRRAFHLNYVAMLGGDKAVREPWRLALAYLARAGIAWSEEIESVRTINAETRKVIRWQIERGTNAPLTSSMGRLFDAVAALVGIRQTVNYEAQAAIEFEALVDPYETGAYDFGLHDDGIDVTPLIRAVVADVRAGASRGSIAARLHNGVAAMVHQVCGLIRERDGIAHVALSGGVWQNVTLLARTLDLLQQDGFTVYIHHQVPTNDGGLALGQAAVAIARAGKI